MVCVCGQSISTASACCVQLSRRWTTDSASAQSFIAALQTANSRSDIRVRRAACQSGCGARDGMRPTPHVRDLAIRRLGQGSSAVRLQHHAGNAMRSRFRDGSPQNPCARRAMRSAFGLPTGKAGIPMPRVMNERVPSFRQCALRPACAEADPARRSTGILPNSPRCSGQDA